MAQLGIKLIFDRITGSAGAVPFRIAALDHKAIDHPVEDQPVIEPLLR